MILLARVRRPDGDVRDEQVEAASYDGARIALEARIDSGEQLLSLRRPDL